MNRYLIISVSLSSNPIDAFVNYEFVDLIPLELFYSDVDPETAYIFFDLRERVFFVRKGELF